jgi:hypothetical protein
LAAFSFMVVMAIADLIPSDTSVHPSAPMIIVRDALTDITELDHRPIELADRTHVCANT